MPRPLTYTSTLAVPRSMPMYLENTGQLAGGMVLKWADSPTRRPDSRQMCRGALNPGRRAAHAGGGAAGAALGDLDPYQGAAEGDAGGFGPGVLAALEGVL